MSPKLILVVDDEFDIASSLELVLEMEGFLVNIAYNGKEAMVLLNQGLRPDLIITDVMMPVMNGYELFKLMKADPELKKIPLILTSAAQLDERKLTSGEYSTFIRKPFDLYKLIAEVKLVFA